MTEQNTFGPMAFKMVVVSLVLWIVLIPTSIIGLLYNSWGWISFEQYYEILGSPIIQDFYLSQFYRYLGFGWLLLLLIVPVIVAFSVSSSMGPGGANSEDVFILSFKLIAMNIVLMAILSPMTFAGLLNNIGILPDESLFDFLVSDFVQQLYGHEYSWIWVVFPFLILGPIVLTACAREWHQPAPKMIPVTGNPT